MNQVVIKLFISLVVCCSATHPLAPRSFRCSEGHLNGKEKPGLRPAELILVPNQFCLFQLCNNLLHCCIYNATFHIQYLPIQLSCK